MISTKTGLINDVAAVHSFMLMRRLPPRVYKPAPSAATDQLVFYHPSPSVKMTKLCVLVALLVLGVVRAEDVSQCGVCQEQNEVFCESANKYYYCLNGKKIGEAHTCETGTVCSDQLDPCVTEAQIVEGAKHACGTSGGCGTCGTNKYTCVGPTEFSRCVGSQPSATRFSCEQGEICVTQAETDYSSVCVPQCVADFAKLEKTCSDDLAVTTPKPGVTPGPTDRTPICEAAKEGKPTFFYTYYTVTACNEYVYCQRNSLTSSDWTTFYGKCSAPTAFFDTVKKSCVATKPESCTVP